MNSNRKFFIAWSIIWSVGILGFLLQDAPYLQKRGVYLETGYQGLFFSTLQFAASPLYVWSIVGLYHLGGILLLPSLIITKKQLDSVARDYSGNHIDAAQFSRALKNYKRFSARTRWQVRLVDRNRIWCGVDLLTGEDVYMEDAEQLFKGVLIIGAQGTGKTSRYFQVVMKQLAMDPQDRTSFVVFTLKSVDSTKFANFLRGMKRRVLHWAMCNLIDLCVDPSGGIQPETLQSFLQTAASSSGINSKDSFWINGAVSRYVEYLLQSPDPTLGNAFRTFIRDAEQMGPDARMDQGLLETLKPGFGPMTDPGSRVAVLHSPCNGGLHYGPLFAAPNSVFRQIYQNRVETHRTGDLPKYFPPGLYELPRNTRVPFDWGSLVNGLSLILPPPGNSLPELVGANFIKTSLLAWISADMARTQSLLLQRRPEDRYRIVLAQDEGHNFLILNNGENDVGFSDARALAENRQSGQVSILATQSLTRLNKGSKSALDDFLALNGTYFFLGVNGPERGKVLDLVGRVAVTRIERSFGIQEKADSGFASGQGNLGSMNESVRENQLAFLSPELYGQFKEGMAIYTSQGQPHRLIYCPYHDQVEVKVKVKVPSKPLWRKLWKS